MNFAEKMAAAIVSAAQTVAERAARPDARTVTAVYEGTDSQGRHCVRLPGADEAVPLHAMAVEASPGDAVSVTISGGAATGTANLTNPSAGMSTVEAVRESADTARQDTAKLRRDTDEAVDGVSRSAHDARKAADEAQGAADAAQGTADAAQGAADAAQEAADNAQVSAGNAAKTATNYITEDTSGIKVAKSTDATTYQRLTYDGMDIYVGGNLAHRVNANGNKLYQAGVELASFASNLVELGKNATSAVIKMCGGKGTIEYNADDYDATKHYLEVKADYLRLRGTSQAAIYSHYTNGSHIGKKSSAIAYPAELYLFSQQSTNLVNGEGTWDTSEIDMTPVKIAFKSDSVTVNGTSVNDAALFTAGTLPLARGGTGKSTTGISYLGYKWLYTYAPTGGTNGQVTLTESAANYTMLEILFRGNDGYLNSVNVWSPNGKDVALAVIESTANGAVNIKRRTVTISGTKISTATYGEWDGGASTTPSSTNHIYIVGVLGWK